MEDEGVMNWEQSEGNEGMDIRESHKKENNENRGEQNISRI